MLDGVTTRSPRDAVWAAVERQGARALRFRVAKARARRGVPTLVIHGDSHGMLVVIEGGPHGINATHPAEFNQALLAFLAK